MIGVRRRESDPVPPPPDHLAERAEGDPTLLLREVVVTHQVAEAGRLSLPPDPDFDRNAIGRPSRAGDPSSVHDEPHAVRVVRAQQLIEVGIEEGLKMADERRLYEGLIDELRERIGQVQLDGRAGHGLKPLRLDPPPRRSALGRETPRRGQVRAGTTRLGHDLIRDQQPELDADASEADGAAAALRGRGEIVVA